MDYDVISNGRQIGSTTFNYSYCILDCSSATSIDDIFNDVLTPDARASYRPSRPWPSTETVR
jgi:hypothetical protein